MGKSSTQVVQAPTAPAPSASDTASDIAQARLEFDPQIAAQEFGLQQQFLPQQTELQTGLAQQFAPLLAQLQTDIETQQQPQRQALQQDLFPQQSQVVEALAGRALEQLQGDFGTTAEEESAVQNIRERQAGALQEQLRTRANLGGGLFGGRAQRTEQDALRGLTQQFAQQDIDRRIQGGQRAAQAAIPLAQILFPQVGTPSIAPQAGKFQFQSAVPSPDVIAQSLFQASQPQSFAFRQPGGTSLGFLGQFGSR